MIRVAKTIAEARFPTLRRGLCGYWAAPHGASGTVLHDWSGRRGDGTLNGTSRWIFDSTLRRWALNFNGTSDTVDCGKVSSLANFAATTANPGTTWAFWIKATTNVVGTIAARNDGNSVSPGWWIHFQNDGRLAITLERSTTNAKAVTSNAFPLTWSFATITFNGVDANSIQFCINGVPCGTSVVATGSGSSGTDIAETFYLGRYGKTTSGGNGFLNAMLADFATWNRVVQPSEIGLLSRVPFAPILAAEDEMPLDSGSAAAVEYFQRMYQEV